MSATNYAFCPNCTRIFREAREKGLARAKALYGNVSADEYSAGLEKARALPAEPDEETLREDYQLGTYLDRDTGTVRFDVAYLCECPNCGFRFSFTHNEPVNTKGRTA